MKTFRNITLEYDVEELVRFCHMEGIRKRIDDIECIIDEGYKLLNPRAMYKRIKISEVKGSRLILEGGVFLDSELLAEKLKCAPEIAIYIVTAGPALETRAAELGSDYLVESFIIDCVGTYALRQVFDVIKRDFQPDNMRLLSKFSPGSTSYWDMSQQRVLFEILGPKNVKEITGVILNEYCVMIPRKSISGVMGVTEKQFRECQICKVRCEYRRAPFKE